MIPWAFHLLGELPTPQRVYTHLSKLEDMDFYGLEGYEILDTGRDLVLRVELGEETGGVKNEAGICREVVTLISNLEDADIGVASEDAAMLDTLDTVLVLN